MPVQNNDKLTSTILYLLRGYTGVRPGLTSLLKMIYFADYWHYQRHLSSITGARYVALERGPVIDQYAQVFAELEASEVLEMQEIPIQGHAAQVKQEYVSKVQPDESLFSETELEVLNEVIRKCGGATGRSLSEKTHREGPWSFIWDAKTPGRHIPYIAFRWLENLPNEDDLAEAQRVVSQPELIQQIERLNAVATV